MKHIILAFALLGATTSFCQAQSWVKPTEAELKAEKQILVQKTSDLQSLVNQHKTDKAEQAAYDLLVAMKKGVAQTRNLAETSGAQKDAIIKRMLEMEQMVGDFMKLRADVNKNGAQLVSISNSFQAKLSK